MPRSSERKQQRLPRGSLDRQKILSAAFDLCAERGLRALNMQAVAERLGVQPTAIHWHFARKQDLVQALIEDAAQRFNDLMPSRTDGSWDDNVRAYWAAYRDVLRASPGLCELVVGEWTTAAHLSVARGRNYRRIDSQLGVLLEAGFAPEQAARAYHLLSTYTRGCLLNERMAAVGVSRAEHEPMADVETDPDWLPNLREAIPYWSYTFATDADFTFGLSVIIGGLRAELAASRPVGRRRGSAG